MKVLGTKNFLQMKFKLLGIDEKKWHDTLGDLPLAFMMIIYGNSGNGKTEFCMQLAKYLAVSDKVAWLSYEQGHGYDLQRAVIRNKMDEVAGNFMIIDPLANLKTDGKKEMRQVLLDDLTAYLSKRNSPKFVFIDSYDYTEFTLDDYKALKTAFGKKKSFIWISHADEGTGKKPATKVGSKIQYDGGLGFLVDRFIVKVKKNRFGGEADYIVYEKRARELNPVYFKLKEAENATLIKKKPGRPPRAKQEPVKQDDALTAAMRLHFKDGNKLL